jgi:TolA-binding protein
MNRAIASSLVLLTSLTSCQYLRLPEPYPSDESSAQAPSYASNEMAPLQQTAKSTLLADNEQLRDQLALALEDRRKLTTALSQEQDELAQLRQQCKDREDAIAQLSEQLAQTKKHLADRCTRWRRSSAWRSRRNCSSARSPNARISGISHEREVPRRPGRRRTRAVRMQDVEA